MSGPPPPPPPPGIAGMPNLSQAKGNGSDGRSMLLESIRQGKTLKKTVTTDKSKPVISNNSKNGTRAAPQAPQSVANSNRPTNDTPPQQLSPVGLGLLFPNGIPKLKATGLPIGQAYQQYRNENDTLDAPRSNIVKVNGNLTTNARARGPPPQPPGMPQKNMIEMQHRVPSNAGANENSYPNRFADGGHKPMLAPKPSATAVSNKITAPNTDNAKEDVRHMITRAQSMRVSRSATTVHVEAKNESQFVESNQSKLYGMNDKANLPSFHQSQESLGRRLPRAPSPPRGVPSYNWSGSATLKPYHSRNHHGVIRAPLVKPPPPPTRMAMNPPVCPPPPPPSQAPPPPPHRFRPQQPASAPPSRNRAHFAGNMNLMAPPTPPVRNSSMKSTQNFDLRFASAFRTVDEFPPPPLYKNILKIYNSRIQMKQPAPLPPLPQPMTLQQINQMWEDAETSNC